MNATEGRTSVRLRLILIGLLILCETAFFGSRCASGFVRLMGERAYFRGEYTRAWALYERAAMLGTDPIQNATDKAELLLFGLDQKNLGLNVDLPMEAESIPGAARDLVSRLLAAAPYRAYFWSLAADVYTHEALAIRRATPLDLSAISDDPLENLLPQDGLSATALAEAARREPRNSIYDDLLAEQFAQWGLLDLAIPHVRRAVALYPNLQGHIFLSRPRLEPGIVDAAIEGFENGLRMSSLIPDDSIECDAGRFLAGQGRHEQALAHFRKALEINPANPTVLYWHGISSSRLGDYATAIDLLSRASEALPDSAYLWYHLGQAQLKMGDIEAGTASLRSARTLDPHQVQFFHALARALEAAGEIKDAERQFQAAANLNPDDRSAWLALLRFYDRHSELSTAARQVCSRISRSGVPVEVYTELCATLMRRAP